MAVTEGCMQVGHLHRTDSNLHHPLVCIFAEKDSHCSRIMSPNTPHRFEGQRVQTVTCQAFCDVTRSFVAQCQIMLGWNESAGVCSHLWSPCQLESTQPLSIKLSWCVDFWAPLYMRIVPPPRDKRQTSHYPKEKLILGHITASKYTGLILGQCLSADVTVLRPWNWSQSTYFEVAEL